MSLRRHRVPLAGVSASPCTSLPRRSRVLSAKAANRWWKDRSDISALGCIFRSLSRTISWGHEVSAIRPRPPFFRYRGLPRQRRGESRPWRSDRGLVLPLSPLHPFYGLLMFDTPTLALAQIVSMASERRLNISLIISTKSLDLPLKRITLRTGHPILTSLAP